MKLFRSLSGLAAACFTILFGSEAAGTANIGGVVSVLAGSGVCADNKLVPGNTLQDTFMLSGAAACSGGSASADLHAEAATASVGLRASSVGNGFGSSSAAAQVQLFDHWMLSVPVGTAAGTFSIPVSLELEGSVSPGAVYDTTFQRILDYSLSIRDSNSGIGPGTSFSIFDRVAVSGNFSRIVSGSVNFRYFGPGSALPMTAEVVMSLSLISLLEGNVDFYNTASISMDLPPGFSATTSSGLPLVFPPNPDADADGIADLMDNCPYSVNPGQEDTGGLGSGSLADGIGDVCQCGDVTGDGRVTLTDAVVIMRSLLQPPTATRTNPERCDVGGSASPSTQGCTLTDAVILRRALLNPPTATISDVCAPANP